MREIKFRAWDKENKRMLPVDYMKLDFGKVPYVNGETFSKDDGWFDYELWYDEFELMQYTGIKDKNGTEIYESDIIEFLTYDGEIPMAQVVFERFAFKALDIEDECCEYDFDDLMDIEVIGNIYENHELLNENT